MEDEVAKNGKEKRTYPVSSLNGRGPSKPGRFLMTDRESTQLQERSNTIKRFTHDIKNTRPNVSAMEQQNIYILIG